MDKTEELKLKVAEIVEKTLIELVGKTSTELVRKTLTEEIFNLMQNAGWKTPEEVRILTLEYLGIETPCPKCSGSGERAYGNTTGWRGGAGGNMVTGDTCDACWGSGDKDNPGINLRVLERILTKEQKDIFTKQRERDRERDLERDKKHKYLYYS